MSESNPEIFENFLGDFVEQFFGLKKKKEGYTPPGEWAFSVAKPSRKKDYYPEGFEANTQRAIYSLYLNGFSDEEITIRLNYEEPGLNLNPNEIGAVIELMNKLLT